MELTKQGTRVSGAWMATVKPQGWVHASLEMEILGSAVRKWNQLDSQIFFFRIFLLSADVFNLAVIGDNVSAP